MLTRYLLVGCGGFLGAIARYAVVELLPRTKVPLATFVVNVSGCFLAGLLLGATVDPRWRLLLATGFLGAYTTFSAFEIETHGLVVSHAAGWAAANVIASVVAGYVAVMLGAALTVRSSA